MNGPPSTEGLDRLALALLVGGPYSVDGVPTRLVSAAWPRDQEHPRRARAARALVVGLVQAGLASLLDVRYASDRATAAVTRPIPVGEAVQDPARLFPVGAAAPSREGVPHLFAEEPLDLLMWPGGATPAPDDEGRRRLSVGLGRLHALCVTASEADGPAVEIDVLALLDVLVRVRFAGAEPPEPAVSSVMLVLSAVAGANAADPVRDVAGLLAFLTERTGWAPSATPWVAPADLFGADAWLTRR
ncbi:hypothetical protein [Oerskovia enterophila]|uniref:Uncharacterized protein n=1 Tax=Oerskovia enterophila TaxID=43678 RepID=A0A163SB49_9CELL|nr:hypothetical protein [Oerskovia enterophila]KZM36203.1 hypothetical protein OJAG_10820 [Oerskovia enterophila]